MNATASRYRASRYLGILLATVLAWMASARAVLAQAPAGSPDRWLVGPTSSLILAQAGRGAVEPAPPEEPPAEEPEVSDEDTNYVLWIVLVLGVGFVSLVVYLALTQNKPGGGGRKRRKRPGSVEVTETQVDNYRLVNLMMTGQTSQVWEVAEMSSGRHFALKMLLPEHVQTQAHRHFLFHEAEVGRQIAHPKIIKILTLKKDPEHPYIVMEFFPSTNLKLRIMHKEDYVRENLKSIIEQTTLALAFMHEKGWVHRDVKPDNILVNSSVEVRLIDFALAQRVRKGKGKSLFGRRKGKAMGTRSYMSPEQIRGEGLDGRADLYSLGATIYEMITFRPPFRASTPQELLQKHFLEKPAAPQIYNPEVSKELGDLVLRMLAKNREDRFRDLHEFLSKFKSLPTLFKSPVAKKKSD